MPKKQALRKKAPPARRAKPAPQGAVWPVQEARAHLSALIDAALSGRPQRITRHGKEAVVVVREGDFSEPPFRTTKEWLTAMQKSPLGELIEQKLIDFEAMRGESPVGPPLDLGDPTDRS